MSIFIVSDGKFIISESEFNILCCVINILDSKNHKKSNKCIVCYHFSCKNPTQNNKFFIYCFCLNKIILRRHSLNQLSYEQNNNFIFLLRCVVYIVGQKTVTSDPWPEETFFLKNYLLS